MTKHVKRTFVAVLAVALSAALLLSGCSAPKLIIGGISRTAGTIGEEKVATGEYLAYLYNSFYSMYYSQGLYQYAQYGYDAWGQEYTYGEGDDEQKVDLAEYIKLTAKDNLVRQAALRQLLKKYNIEWNADKLKETEEQLASLGKDAYLALGINDEHFADAYKQLVLNEYSVFYTLYGKGGEREVSEADRRAYFEKNFVSYKIIEMSLLDSEGAEMGDKAKKEVTDELEDYLAIYKQTGSFEKAVDTYNKSQATDGEETQASTDAQNRKDVDASQADEQLIKAVRSVDVGSAKVVTYKAGGTTPTAALILRLDIHTPNTLFADKTEEILYGAKHEEFDAEVQKVIDGLPVKLKASVVKKCSPKNFVTNE
ncbi:MAG: hypothetical protein II363_01605 [Clostridia bacterium]|nr:hypothetical protein [Clostridia bacterium]